MKVRVLASLSLLLVALVVCEGALWFAGAMSVTARRALSPPWEVLAPTIPDDRLGRRGNPLHPEHDRAGYRNLGRPNQANIVVLGDSHAYGSGIAAWPVKLGAYNMALPSYGPGHSLLQLDEALSLRPRLVIVAPYAGNDFAETYILARRHPALLRGLAPELVAAAAAIDQERRLEDEANIFWTETERNAQTSGARAWVSQNVKLYGLARGLLYRLSYHPAPPLLSRNFSEAARALTPAQRRYAAPFEGGGWRTILTPSYRALVLDDRDPRIRVGFEASVGALLAIHARCRVAGVRALVVLLPTKESVFSHRVRDASAHPALARLVGDEARLRGELLTALDRAGIPYVDALHALHSASAQTYFEDVDGHPNDQGHAVIASIVAEHVRRMLDQ